MNEDAHPVAHWTRQSHQTAAAQMEAALAVVGVHPAQVLALAQRRGIDPVLLTSVLYSRARAQFFTSAEMPALREVASRYAAHSQQRGADAFQRLDAAYSHLPGALRAISLDWAAQLLQEIERDAAIVLDPAHSASVQQRGDANRMATYARQSIQAEVQRRAAQTDGVTPTPAELDAVRALLRRHDLPVDDGLAQMLWQDVRQAQRQQLAALRLEGQEPPDVLEGRLSRDEFIAHSRSVRTFMDYLQNDPLAFGRIASQRLFPRLAYDRLAAAADNGGVLRREQLRAIESEPDAQRREQMANLAHSNFREGLVKDWTGFRRDGERPQYREFAEFAASPRGASLFENARGPRDPEPMAMRYRALVLDFIRGIEQWLDLDNPAATVNRRDLIVAKRQVAQQIELIDERGLSLTPVSDPQNRGRALRLLTDLQNKLNQL
jgi:hypothetical protein